MRKLTTAEVARMTGMQVESMNDDAVLYHHSTAQDSLGQMIDTFDTGNLVTCGITANKEHRNERGEVVTIDADAVLRLTMSQSINIGDKVTHGGKSYLVDGAQAGRNVNIIPLMEIKI